MSTVEKVAAHRDTALPPGFTVQLDRRARWLGPGTLLGGAPPRLLRLSATARGLLTGDRLRVTDRLSGRLARTLLDAGVAHPRPDGDQDIPPVSVVIPVRDRAAELRRLLDALTGTLPAGSEIIVVDDGSPVPTVTGTGTRLLRHPRGLGPAAARNTGLAAARHELVCFLDSDVVSSPGWLPELLAQFADPAVALAAPRVLGLRKAGDGALARYEHARSSLDLGPDEALIVPRTRVAYVPSAALVLRAAAAPDGFAAELRVAEDVDLVCRLHAAGWLLRYVPSATVTHEHRDRPGPWLSRKAFYGTGAAALAVRHPGAVPPVNLPAWAAAAVLLLGAGGRRGPLGAALLTGLATVKLGRSVGPRAAIRLNGMALGGAGWQAAGVLTRHWWPLALLGALGSVRLRRALLAAALIEGITDWARHRGELDPLRYLVLHRLDDLGYGAGLWAGAIRARTAAPLLPRFSGLPRLPSRARFSSWLAARRRASA